jgi:hypothetical protein
MNNDTESRTYVGATHGQAFDGWCGFRIGQRYDLYFTREFDEVTLHLPHAPGRSTKLSVEDFNLWFKK